MYKSKAFEKIIGFNHTWFIISMILLTGLTFPVIFLNNTWASVWQGIYFNLPFGVIFASFVLIGNLMIIYRVKSRQNKDKPHDVSRLMMLLGYQLVYTTLIAYLLTSFLCMVAPQMNNPGYIQRSIIGNLILTAVFTGFYEAAYYLNELKKSIRQKEELKRAQVESQMEILKNQVQPHFLFNSLNTLSSIIPTEPEMAVHYVQNLSKVYRYILEIKDKKLIHLSEELACIEAYLFLLKIRFGDNLKVEIDINEVANNGHVIPLSLQLLVENAMKHNIVSNKRPLHIDITNKGETLEISNNLQLKQQKQASTGTGLANIRRRYQILTGKDIQIEETPTIFKVNIPIIQVL